MWSDPWRGHRPLQRQRELRPELMNRVAKLLAGAFVIATGVAAILSAMIWWLGLIVGLVGMGASLVLRRSAAIRIATSVGAMLSCAAVLLSLAVAVALTPAHTTPAPAESRPAVRAN
ncbi:MAG TPA: hypothetical protein VKQ07_00535 [Jatrophihabitantaceae bacterium]|nr:hypothetical protein [Jatrophihabitantaceae bacterium]